MEAPKKIWVSDMGGWFETESSHDIPYIRADIVEEMIEQVHCDYMNSRVLEEG